MVPTVGRLCFPFANGWQPLLECDMKRLARGFGELVGAMALSGIIWLVFAEAQEPGEARWYKGNTHAHSLWSDGNDFPENIVHWYHSNGYHFAVLSDHNILPVGEKWLPVSKRVRPAIEKAEALFGEDWVVERVVEDRRQVRLRRPEEYRKRFEAPEAFLLVQAEEVTASYFDEEAKRRRGIHINAINPSELISPDNKGFTAVEVMRKNLAAIATQEARTGQLVLSHLNHPNFQGAVTGEDLGAVVEEMFFEVYNGHPGVLHRGKKGVPGDEAIWDIANAIRAKTPGAPLLYGVATDDCHQYHGGRNPPGRGWVMVRAKSLHPEALILAMRAGDFYASTGVTLADVEVDVERREVWVEVAAVEGETYAAEWIGTREDGDETGEVFETAEGTEFRFVLPEDALYGRIKVQSSAAHPSPSYEGQQKEAWCQPVRF